MPVMDGYTLLRHWKADDTPEGRFPSSSTPPPTPSPKDERLAAGSRRRRLSSIKPAEPEPFMRDLRKVLAEAAAAIMRGARRRGRGKRSSQGVQRGPHSQAGGEDRSAGGDQPGALRGRSRSAGAPRRRLREKEAKLSVGDRAMQAVSQGIVITDADGRTTPSSTPVPASSESPGTPVEEVLGRRLPRSCRARTRPGASGADSGEAVAQGRRIATSSCSITERTARRSGTTLTISPVGEAGGTCTRLRRACNRDVTERRRWRSSSARRRRWRRSAGSPAASPTTSTTC